MRFSLNNMLFFGAVITVIAIGLGLYWSGHSPAEKWLYYFEKPGAEYAQVLLTNPKPPDPPKILQQNKINLDIDTGAHLTRLCKLFCGQAARPISTSKLNALPHLHTWPINLVVFEGSSVSPVSRGKGYLISGLASRLDAFSGYPFRT